MTLRERSRKAVFPPATVSKFDTGLRFTDILFGFVISELFFRLQDWGALPWFVRAQQIAGVTLVLGSWIGFRRSINRSSYELKFVNLPLLRFVLDQVMVLFYFRVAILTPRNPDVPVDPASLVHDTAQALVIVFALYLVWDLGGVWMAYAKDPEERRLARYPRVNEEGEKTEEFTSRNWSGLFISATFLGLLAALWLISDQISIAQTGATICFVIATVLLFAYRLSKEVRTSWSST